MIRSEKAWHKGGERPPLCKNQPKTGSKTNVQVLLAALKACNRTRNLEKGKKVHAEAAQCGFDCSNIYVVNTLINMYAKCSSMVDARKVFEGTLHADVASWTVLILGYAYNGQSYTALELFTRMKSEGPTPDSVTLVAVLKACLSLALKEGPSQWPKCRSTSKKIQNVAVENGCSSDVYLQSTLLDIYAKCGSILDAREVFSSMKHPDVVSWTALVLGYVENGQGHTALVLFTKMLIVGPAPNSVTVVAALKACTSLAVKEGASRSAEWRDKGKEIHNLAVENSCYSDGYVQSTLVDMYAKCNSMEDARKVFDHMKHPTVVTWTGLILGYANNGQGHTAIDLFSRMRFHATPDSVTLMAVLKACTSLAVKERWVGSSDMVKVVHNFAVENDCICDSYVQSTLLDIYAKCGNMADARHLFESMKYPDVVSWTTMILGYADNNDAQNSLYFFTRMRNEGPLPNSITLVSALKACTSLATNEGASRWVDCRDWGKELHSVAVENDCVFDVYVQSTLVDMYAKCGSMKNAREVFENIKDPDVVSWTVLILGYADNGQGYTALNLYNRMRTEGPAPDSVTFGSVLKACGQVGALEFGRTIHSEVDSLNNLDVVMVTCLVDFYAKCGSLVEAKNVFDLHSLSRGMITWNALLAGFSSCGDDESVFALFQGMQDAGFRPDGITFLCILTCCSHMGLVVKGKEYFDAMYTAYGVIPSVEHYTCMIDLFGRVNMLDDAMALLKSMPCSPDNVTWMTIMGACRKWKNVEIGRLAFESLIDLNDKDAAAYVLMGQIYGSRGMLKEQSTVMGLRKKIKAYKLSEEACWTNEAGEVHAFLGEDNRHPQIHEICDKWKSMSVMMRQHGYTPIRNTEHEALCGHSERLALVCAVMNTQLRKPIRIVKNLRVCNDCHAAIALISKLECREIICRDASRIHIFKGGKCSCRDFW